MSRRPSPAWPKPRWTGRYDLVKCLAPELSVDLTLIGKPLPRVGHPVPLVSGRVPPVGLGRAQVGDGVALIRGVVAPIGPPITPVRRLFPQDKQRLSGGMRTL